MVTMFRELSPKDKAGVAGLARFGSKESHCKQPRVALEKEEHPLSVFHAWRVNTTPLRRREVLVSPEGVGMGFNVSLVEAGTAWRSTAGS